MIWFKCICLQSSDNANEQYVLISDFACISCLLGFPDQRTDWDNEPEKKTAFDVPKK